METHCSHNSLYIRFDGIMACSNCGEVVNQPATTASDSTVTPNMSETKQSSNSLTWEEAKDQVAKKHGWINWNHFIFFFAGFIKQGEPYFDQAAELYASSRVREVEEINAKLTGIVTHFEHEMELTKSLLEASEQENKRLQERLEAAEYKLKHTFGF